MNARTKGILTIALIAIFGGMIGFAVRGYGGAVPPIPHTQIIEQITVTDLTESFSLKPKCVASGNVEWAKYSQIYGLAMFETGDKYSHSTWVWSRFDDTEVVMTIWGAGTDGSTYLVEVARLGCNSFQIKLGQTIQVTFASTGSSPTEGYAWFYAELP